MKLHTIIIVIACTIIGLTSLYILQQISADANRLPLRPRRIEHTAPRKKKIHWKNSTEERVTFTSQYAHSSNKRIVRHGILVRKPHARAIVLICHGFMCNKDDVRFLQSIFSDYTTFTFDFRAHGDSIQGQYCTLGSREMFDVIGAVDFIKSQPDLKNLPLIVYGFSMGAVASILAQSYAGNLFDAAIWDCPFDSTDNLLERSIERLKITIGGYELNVPGRSILKKYAYNEYVQELLKAALKTIAKMDATAINTCIEPVNTVEAAKKISIPVLFITCKNDSKAPIEAVSAIYESTCKNCYKRLWLTDGRYHYDSYFYHPVKYRHRVLDHIKKFLDGTYKNEQPRGIWDDNPQDDFEYPDILIAE